MTDIIDLHCHSHHSDGELNPTALIQLAKSQGITTIALTDHDTTEGIAEAAEAAKACGIRLITGVELSTQWMTHSIHVVALDIDIEHPALQEALKKNFHLRQKRAKKIAHRLESMGILNAYAEAKAIAGEGIITRPHFARLLIEKRKVGDMQEAFKRYLGQGRPAYVEMEWQPMVEATALIREAGGIPVVAHPARYKITFSKLRRLLTDFKAAGGLAMEVAAGSHSIVEINQMVTLCQALDLYASAGSDYHGPKTGRAVLGRMPAMPAQCRPVWDLFKEGSDQ